MPPTKSGAFFIAKNIFKKIFNYLEHFGVSMSGYIQRRLRIGLTVRFSFSRMPLVHTVSAQLNPLTSVIRSGADMPRQRAVRHVRRRKRCESTFRKESQATATRRNTWSRESIGTTLGQGFWRSRNSFGLSPETWYASAIA